MLRAVGAILVWLGPGAVVAGDVSPIHFGGMARTERTNDPCDPDGEGYSCPNARSWRDAAGRMGPPVADTDHRERFFDIWLVERGRSPELTRRLLGQ